VVKYGETDQLTVVNYFAGSSSYRVEQFQFSDGVVWDDAAIKSRVITLGDAAANSISGYSDGMNRIYGLEGNDNLYGGAQADLIDGGVGGDSLTGNAGDDLLLGGDGNDTLDGGAGADTLEGGVGSDAMNGGTGNDTYLFTPGTGADTISDYDTTTGNTDLLSFGAGITAEQLWFRQVGANLEVSLIGTTDKATLSNWYSGSTYHLEQFKTSDGKTLLDSQVQALVSAMAAFAPPAAGQTGLPADYQTALAPVIAANWA
jgi:Ca2+-binding RTX toxin-like protein